MLYSLFVFGQTHLAVNYQSNLVPSSASSRRSHRVKSMVTLIWFDLTTPVSNIQTACSTCRWVMPTISLTNRSSIAQLIEHGPLATHSYEIILSISVFLLLFANIHSAISHKNNKFQITNIEIKNWHFSLMVFIVSPLLLFLSRSICLSISLFLSQYSVFSCILALIACGVFLRVSFEVKVVFLTLASAAYYIIILSAKAGLFSCYGQMLYNQLNENRYYSMCCVPGLG